MNCSKHCPKCGSTNINFLVFYRPSIWKCLDCGYEGSLIIESNLFHDEMQERYRKGFSAIDWTGGGPRTEYWNRLRL